MFSSLNANRSAVEGATLKSVRELESMREAGRIVAFAVQRMVEALEPGITTAELDRLGKGEIEKLGAMPAFLGLYGFPATACISVNEEIVHGIPGDRTVADGDLVSFDCGAIVDGMYSDHAVTVIAGPPRPRNGRLSTLRNKASIWRFRRLGPEIGWATYRTR